MWAAVVQFYENELRAEEASPELNLDATSQLEPDAAKAVRRQLSTISVRMTSITTKQAMTEYMALSDDLA